MLGTIYIAIRYLIKLLEFAIFVTVIISWLPVSKDNRFIILLYQVTEPIMAPIRKMLKKSSFTNNLMIDFSPVVAILLLELVNTIAYKILV